MATNSRLHTLRKFDEKQKLTITNNHYEKPQQVLQAMAKQKGKPATTKHFEEVSLDYYLLL